MTNFFPNPEALYNSRRLVIPNPESRIPNPESRIPNPESRIPNQGVVGRPGMALTGTVGSSLSSRR